MCALWIPREILFHGYFVRLLSTFCQDAHPLKECLALVGERETFPRVLSTLLRIPGWGTTLLPSLNKPCRRGHVHVAQGRDSRREPYNLWENDALLDVELLARYLPQVFAARRKYLPNPTKNEISSYRFSITDLSIRSSYSNADRFRTSRVYFDIYFGT